MVKQLPGNQEAVGSDCTTGRNKNGHGGGGEHLHKKLSSGPGGSQWKHSNVKLN